MIIDLTLQLTSSYHSPPISGQALVVTNEGRIATKASGAKGSPLTATYKEPKFIPATGEIQYFPVIRSLQLIKQIRNIVNRNIIHSLKARGLSIAKPSTCAGMDVGAASGKPAQMDATLDQTVQAMEEPIALFGGGSFCLPSILTASDANVLHEVLIEEGLVTVPAHFDRSLALNLEHYQLTFTVPITRQDPINDICHPEQMDNLKVLENYKEQIEAWQKAVKSAQASRKEATNEKKIDLNNMVAIEAVVPGVTFSARLSIPDQAGAAVKGAVISTVAELCSNGMTVGGRTSRGSGRIAVQASVDGAVLDVENYYAEVDSYSRWLEQVAPATLAAFFEA